MGSTGNTTSNMFSHKSADKGANSGKMEESPGATSKGFGNDHAGSKGSKGGKGLSDMPSDKPEEDSDSGPLGKMPGVSLANSGAEHAGSHSPAGKTQSPEPGSVPEHASGQSLPR